MSYVRNGRNLKLLKNKRSWKTRIFCYHPVVNGKRLYEDRETVEYK